MSTEAAQAHSQKSQPARVSSLPVTPDFAMCPTSDISMLDWLLQRSSGPEGGGGGGGGGGAGGGVYSYSVDTGIGGNVAVAGVEAEEARVREACEGLVSPSV